MRSATSIFVLGAVALFAIGCEEKPGASTSSTAAKPTGEKPAATAEAKPAPAAAKIASCNLIKSESMCREWGEQNISAAGEEFIKGLCTGGEYKNEACPADKRVGSCKTTEGTKVYYSDGALPLEAAQAEKACKEGVPAGEWKAGG